MLPTPNRLALLVSLIGAGLAPGAAQARIDDRRLDAVPSPVDVALRAAAQAAVVHPAPWAPGPGWRTIADGVRLVAPHDTAGFGGVTPHDAAGFGGVTPHDAAGFGGATAAGGPDGAAVDAPVRRIAAVTFGRPAPASLAAPTARPVPKAAAAESPHDRILRSLVAVLCAESDLVAPGHAVADAAAPALAAPVPVARVPAVADAAAPGLAAPATDAVPQRTATPAATAAQGARVLSTLASIAGSRGVSADRALRPTRAAAGSGARVAVRDPAAAGSHATGRAAGRPSTPSQRPAPLDLDLDLSERRATAVAVSTPARVDTDATEPRAARAAPGAAPLDLDLTERPPLAASTASSTVDINIDIDVDVVLPGPVASMKAVPPLDLDLDLTMPDPAEALKAAVWPALDLDLTLPAAAAGAAPAARPFGDRTVAIDERSLDRIRGGFVGENLTISFGIERAVYINGALVTTTSLNLSELGRMTGGRSGTPVDTGSLGLVQSGVGNTVAMGSLASTSLGTVIQNTLDGQKIESVTVINATVNSLGILKGLNFQSSLRGAVIDSLRR